MDKKIKEFLFINIGLIFVAVGIYFFLAPNNLAAGGVSGFSIVISHFIPSMPVGLLMLVMNGILLLVGFIFLGPSFGTKTIYSSLVLSGMVWLLDKIYPIVEPLSDDVFIQLIYGISLSAIGMAIVFYQEASTGGTDIIAKIINKYLKFDIGKSLLMADFLIVISAGVVFGLQLGMYALLGVFMNGFIIDNVIQGFSVSKQVVIISEKSDRIKEFIVKDLKRGATIYTARGAYSNEEKEVISTVLSRREFVQLRNFIRGIDGRAFITVNNMHEILGEGFKNLD